MSHFNILRIMTFLGAAAFSVSWSYCIPNEPLAAPPVGDPIGYSVEQAAYWRQDEIRETMLAHVDAEGLAVPKWPNMSLATPKVEIAVPLLESNETFGANAAHRNVGPVFDAWESGPFEYKLLAGIKGRRIWIAIDSPRGLDQLGALTPDRELMRINGTPLRIVDGQLVCDDPSYEWTYAAEPHLGRHPLEITFSYDGSAPIELILPAELVRYDDNDALPSGCASLGMDRMATPGNTNDFRKNALWIQPYRVTLVPSADAKAAIEARSVPYPRIGFPEWNLMTTAERTEYCRDRRLRAAEMLALLDAPLLFVKRNPYFAGHIYDDYYTWRPGPGGIFALEEPAQAAFQEADQRQVRTIINAESAETLGDGIYRDPAISWDADRMLFAYRPTSESRTNIYEIGVNGRGLRRLTSSVEYDDITPDYLSDDRIVFTSTRPKALVPCFNSGVDTLHVMNSDGSGIQSISANNVTEFDPAILPDGRILYGRWEYVDKTALYMQSIWAMLPDGSMEEAVYGNNMAKPTAILDARAVDDSHKIIASLTPHNGQAVGAIGMIDPRLGKNDLAAIENFTPEYPVEMDQGLRSGPSDPWALSESLVLMSNNAIGAHGIIELVDSENRRELVHCDPEISLFAPMLVKERVRPRGVTPRVQPRATTGRFALVDVYQGLDGIERGEAKQLRIVEETARISGLPPGGRWWNQAFLVSWQGSYIIKNILGVVPIHEDGSAYFEVPSGKAIYFELLDENGREIQRMRTFVNAAPGATRSCVGCHENKKSTPIGTTEGLPLAVLGDPVRPQPESWGSGYIDYPTMIQPILDDHCVECHGGEKGIGKGIDFSGGWTWAFNISYESMLKNRLTGYLNCNNGSVHTSERIPPRTIGSGGAPLAERMLKYNHGMTRADRDLLFAWMDTNSNYYGTWDYTQYATCNAIMTAKTPLASIMNETGCTDCHASGHIGNDWINLEHPEWSRILRAPMAASEEGDESGNLGLGFCRDRDARTGYPLVNQSVQPPDVFLPTKQPEWDPSGEPHITWASTENEHYQAMLDVIQRTRDAALATPRIDMPGSIPTPGECRVQVAMPVPMESPLLTAQLRDDGLVELTWQRNASTIGLQYILHRGESPDFLASESTQIGLTTAGRFVDEEAPLGDVLHYAITVSSRTQTSLPSRTSIFAPMPPLPTSPAAFQGEAYPGETILSWRNASQSSGMTYQAYRSRIPQPESALNPILSQWEQLSDEPFVGLSFSDRTVEPGLIYVYSIQPIDRFGRAGEETPPIVVRALPMIREPVFHASFGESGAVGQTFEGESVEGRLQGEATIQEGRLNLGESGFLSFPQRNEYDPTRALTIVIWIKVENETQMPVLACHGSYNRNGWFLQRYGSGYRFHVSPTSCDGGRPVIGEWTHLVGIYDGRTARLYQDGALVGTQAVSSAMTPASNQLLILGQYGSQGDQYQTIGQIASFDIYARALSPEEIREQFEAGTPTP